MENAIVKQKEKNCTLAWLLDPWFDVSSDKCISGMTLDSRAINSGDLFVALQGAVTDGRTYIQQAIQAGAVAVLSETEDIAENGIVTTEKNIPIIKIFQLGKYLSEISMRFYFPKTDIHPITAVTGTNGKTTIASLLANSYQLLNKSSAQMGTIGNGLYGQLHASLNTTLDAISVCRELSSYQKQGVQRTIMEVSSHGLIQGRISAIPFTSAIFTNLTRDHLDYHGTIEAYADAKETLFKEFPLKHKIINADDNTGKVWLARYPEAIAYGFNTSEHSQQYFKITEAQYLAQGLAFKYISSWGKGNINAPFYGAFNISNIAAVSCALLADNYSLQEVEHTVSNLTVVPGRMEQYFFARQQVTFVVDYAHTPDALESALKALQAHKQQGRIIAVFGCGGDRDKGKRPEMAKAAEKYSEQVIIVDDNPRSENAQAIVEDIKQGLINPEQATVIHDRKEAIIHLLDNAQANDIILVAGKGHEDYQIFGDKKVHYSDRECLSELLENERKESCINNKNQESAL